MMTKNTHNFIIPNNIHFSETPKIIEIQNFEPLKMVTYIHENIRAFSCKGGGGGSQTGWQKTGMPTDRLTGRQTGTCTRVSSKIP